MDDLISRQAAIEEVASFYPPKRQNESEAETINRVGWECAINCIEAYLRTVKPARQWTPCGVKLPEDKKAVYWVCNDNGDQFECRWTNANYFWTEPKTKWHWSLFDVPQYSKVVAWMPLPEPYKEMDEDPSHPFADSVMMGEMSEE